MAKDGKFGTFGGVFTPSILTILGVIMYLRLPWVVGEGGLASAVAIILVAHVISLCTGLSISSIATDKAVGAGGPYYIISRSLGLPLGGTIGIALFFGLSFSISLYIIGFAESLLSYFELPTDPDTIRLAGTGTLVALTVLTFISTALAIKTQYVILALIAASLVSIFFGQPDAPAQLHWARPAGGESPYLLFGIFFPAVTGFTAGVNMSGDLRDARRSIPLGSMSAIVGGFVVYLSLATFLAFRVDPVLLREDPSVLVSIALVPILVVAGIWGATLSSALGSILGAPRILQAVSADRITPAWFAKGTGKSNEPRNALFLAFVIGEAGILIAELDVIARIVSMVFLALYGFLNLIAAIETWASPDFRPTFKIPRAFPVIGALTSLVVMVQLDIVAMLASAVLLLGVYALLQRRQLRLEAGDTWEGIWATLVRAGLHRLSQRPPQARNWRPNILAFSRMVRTTGTRPHLLSFGHTMVRGRGLFTDVVLLPPRSREAVERVSPVADDEELPVGMFHEVVRSERDDETIARMCRYHGVSGLRPNAVLLDWTDVRPEPGSPRSAEEVEAFEGLFRDVIHQDLNLMVFRYDAARGFGRRKTIDVWWRRDGGSLPFALSLLRFITAANDWSRVSIRVFLFSEDVADNELLVTRAGRLVEQLRIGASVRAVNPTPEEEDFVELVLARSRDADLVVMGAKLDEAGAMEALDAPLAELGTVLLYRAPSEADEALGRRSVSSAARLELESEGEEGQPLELVVDDNPDIYPPARTFGRKLGALTHAFDRRGLQALYEEEQQLIKGLSDIVERHFQQLEKGVTGQHARRLRRATNRVNSSLLKASKKLLVDFREQVVPRQESTLEHRMRELLEPDELVQSGVRLTVSRELAAFGPAPDDDGWTRRFKRRKRLRGRLRGKQPSYTVDLARLQAHHRERFVLDVLARALRTMRADGHAVIGELGQLVQGAQTAMNLTREVSDGRTVEDYVQDRKRRVLEELAALRERHEARAERTRELLHGGAQQVAQAFADDLARIDITRLIRRKRRPRRALDQLGAEELEALDVWVEHRGLLVDQVQLSLSIADVQHRIAGMVHRIRDAKQLELRNGSLGEMQQLRKSIEVMAEGVQEPTPPVLKGRFDFRNKDRAPRRESVESLQRELPSLLEDLPETVKVLDPESYGRLLEGREDDITTIDLPLRRLVSYLIENELMASLQALLGNAMIAEEQRSRAVGLEVVRMVRFQRKEWDTISEEDGEAADFETHMMPALENARARVEEEIASLEAFEARLVKDVNEHLSESRGHTQLLELVREAGRLLQDRRRSRGLQAFSGAQARVDRWTTAVSERIISRVYGSESAFSLLRRARNRGPEGPMTREQVLMRIQEMQPRQDVLKALPYYYRQLFIGQSSTDEAFWVPRPELQQQARRGIGNHRRGIPGVLLVTGNRGSGKSAFVQWLTSGPLNSRKVYRVFPRRSGSSDPSILDRVFESETGIVGTLEEQLRAMPEQSVLVLRDFELWWTRLEGEDQAVKRLLDMFDAHAGRLLFVVEIGRAALELFDRLYGLRARALAVMSCEPVGMRDISEIVMARHVSAGLSLTVDGVAIEGLSALQKARMFALLQERSGGNIGQALRAWIASVTAVDAEALTMQLPAHDTHDLLGRLTPEEEAMLVAFEVHRALTKPRIARLLDTELREVEEILGGLVRSGLLEESSRDVFEISKFAYMAIWTHLHRRGLTC